LLLDEAQSRRGFSTLKLQGQTTALPALRCRSKIWNIPAHNLTGISAEPPQHAIAALVAKLDSIVHAHHDAGAGAASCQTRPTRLLSSVAATQVCENDIACSMEQGVLARSNWREKIALHPPVAKPRLLAPMPTASQLKQKHLRERRRLNLTVH
jgi:hypothetical protein